MSRQHVTETHRRVPGEEKKTRSRKEALKNAFEAFVINLVRAAEGRSCASVHFHATSPGAFILLSGQLVPPGKQQPEGGELLRVKSPLLPPLQFQVRLLRVYGLYISLH